MKRLISPVFVLFFFLLQLSASSQKSKEILYTDFDLFTLKGTDRVIDSIPWKIKCIPGAENPKKIKLLSSGGKRRRSRTATIHQDGDGTFIGFSIHKEPGFEKVLFIGSKDHYRDSILIKDDTVYYKQLVNDDYLTLRVLLPVRNDTLVIMDIQKNYLYNDDYYYDGWINLKNHREWFKNKKYDRLRIYKFARAGNHYELVGISPQEASEPSPYYQQKYREAGLSLFWMIVWPGVYI